MWLVLLPAVWSQCETFSLCFDNLHAINHGMSMKESHCKCYYVYSFVLIIVLSNTMSQSALSLHICYTMFQ